MRRGGRSSVFTWWHSLILFHVGLMAEAGAGLAVALAAEPDNARVVTFLAQKLFFEGEWEAAHEQLARAFALDPTSFYTHLFQPAVHLYQEDLAAAERSVVTSRNVVGDDALLDASEALLWAKRGEVGRADELLAHTAERPSIMHEHHVLHWAAAAQAVLGRQADAVRSLREASATGLPNYPVFRDDPHFAACRESPPMQELLAELELEWQRFRSEFGANP